MNELMRKWYGKEFPEDSGVCSEFAPRAKFRDLMDAISTGRNVYELLPSDSIVRERCFEHLCALTGSSYKRIYDAWLDGGFGILAYD